MKRLIVIVVLFFSAVTIAQEHGSISGTILDQEMNNEPLLLANIQLKGSDITRQSNLFGNFEISDIRPGEYILEISFAGYETKQASVEVQANNVTEIQETLGAMIFDFDEVITDEDISIAKISSNHVNSGDKE